MEDFDPQLLQPTLGSENNSPMQISEMDSVESELSDAKKAVALKIEEANLRSKEHRKPRWRQQEEPETSLQNEDARYAQVMKEIEHMKHELRKIKLDMARVLKEKRQAERSAKASNSKALTLSATIGLMKREIQELNEEQALVEFARIEAIKECELIEARRKEDENRYKTQVLEAKTNELQIVPSDINLKQQGSPLSTIIDELESAKRELESIKCEGFNFMKSMDVIRDELKHVQDEKTKFRIAEQKREVTVQNLNSKILRARAKLESLTSAETKTNLVVSNLVFTLEQLRAEVETSTKEKDVIDEEIENMNLEIRKTELEMEVMEERLEEAMEELKEIKLSESEALANLKHLINTTVEVRDTDLINSSKITITNFEYEYLMGMAGRAAELADKKIAAAQAWVEALKANEREILMKIEITQREMSELSIEMDPEKEEEEEEEKEEAAEAEEEVVVVVEKPDLEAKVVASPRKSMCRVGGKSWVKSGKLQRLRHSRKSGSLRKVKVMPKLGKFFTNKNVAVDG